MDADFKRELKIAITVLACMGIVAMVLGGIWTLCNQDMSDFYTFTSYADGSSVYIRKDCLCKITTVRGDVYIVPTNGNSVRIKESLDEVREIVKIK